MSVSLMAMAMQALDVPAVSLNAFQVAMHATSRYGNARFKRVDTKRIRHELDEVVQTQLQLRFLRYFMQTNVRFIQMLMESLQLIREL